MAVEAAKRAAKVMRTPVSFIIDVYSSFLFSLTAELAINFGGCVRLDIGHWAT